MSTPSPHHQYPPATPLGEPDPLVRPKAVDTAFLLVLAGIVFGSVGAVVTTLLDHERIVGLVRDTLARTGEAFTEADVVRLIGPMRIACGIVIALFAALLVLVAVKVRLGRNWARLVLTGYALVAMAFFLSAVSDTGAALDLIWTLAGVAFTVAAVIYLFRPDSVKYFTEAKKRR